MTKTTAKKHKRARRWAFPLGLLIAILAIIGAVTVVVAGVGGIKEAVQKSRSFKEYDKLLTPVVMNDPDAFDDIMNANPNQLIDISIWSILKSGLDPDQYEYTAAGMLIPEADVTAEYERLFGKEIAPTHGSVEGYGYDFTYDASKQVYTIPLTGVVPTYTPRVVDLDRQKNAMVLTVAYLAGDQWAQGENGDMIAPEPDKYVKVTLREKDGVQVITALQNVAAPETATTAPQEKPAETTAPATDAGAADELPSETVPVSAEAVAA